MNEAPKVKNYINPNTPECHNKNEDTEWRKRGFINQADYDCWVRRHESRKK